MKKNLTYPHYPHYSPLCCGDGRRLQQSKLAVWLARLTVRVGQIYGR